MKDKNANERFIVEQKILQTENLIDEIGERKREFLRINDVLEQSNRQWFRKMQDASGEFMVKESTNATFYLA